MVMSPGGVPFEDSCYFQNFKTGTEGVWRTTHLSCRKKGDLSVRVKLPQVGDKGAGECHVANRSSSKGIYIGGLGGHIVYSKMTRCPWRLLIYIIGAVKNPGRYVGLGYHSSTSPF